MRSEHAQTTVEHLTMDYHQLSELFRATLVPQLQQAAEQQLNTVRRSTFASAKRGPARGNRLFCDFSTSKRKGSYRAFFKSSWPPISTCQFGNRVRRKGVPPPNPCPQTEKRPKSFHETHFEAFASRIRESKAVLRTKECQNSGGSISGGGVGGMHHLREAL